MACDKRTRELALEFLDKREGLHKTMLDEIVPFLTVLMWNPDQVLPQGAEEALRKALSDAIVDMGNHRIKIREIIRNQSQLAANG